MMVFTLKNTISFREYDSFRPRLSITVRENHNSQYYCIIKKQPTLSLSIYQSSFDLYGVETETQNHIKSGVLVEYGPHQAVIVSYRQLTN
jgi:hypothetical protein